MFIYSLYDLRTDNQRHMKRTHIETPTVSDNTNNDNKGLIFARPLVHSVRSITLSSSLLRNNYHSLTCSHTPNFLGCDTCVSHLHALKYYKDLGPEFDFGLDQSSRTDDGGVKCGVNYLLPVVFLVCCVAPRLLHGTNNTLSQLFRRLSSLLTCVYSCKKKLGTLFQG